MIKRKLILLLLSFVAVFSSAQDIRGSWIGTLDVGGMKVRVVLNFTHGASGSMQCTLDSPDQGVEGIPAEIVFVSQDSVNVTVNALGGSYAGKVANGEMKGTYTQMGYNFPLILKPGAVELKRPQEPKPPYAYTTEEVSIVNGEAGNTLSGTICYPVGYHKMKPKDVPVVVMVTAAGPLNRDEEMMHHKPFLVIADYLARNGIASLRYDSRGVGKSTGNYDATTSEDNMKDAQAAVLFLRQSGKFGRVGVLGHSEGGMVAFMLAAKKVPDFIVSLAAPGVRGDSLLLLQVPVALNASGMSGMDDNKVKNYTAGVRALYDAIREGAGPDEMRKVAAIYKEKTGLELTDRYLKPLNTPWMRYFLGYDPSDDIRHTTCPVMALNGSLDMNVNCNANLGTIKKLLPENKKNLIKVYTGLNHLFQHCRTGYPTEYATIEETISPEVLNDIAMWIKSLQ